uniref:Ribonuclease A-domain domain-containing protein n=1 Tax=Seriola lalandi dorsalis TaxID=1841481 RepID=A0A3B4WVG9_SERLL
MNVWCQFSCLLLVLLSAARCTEAATPEDFKKRHVINKMEERDCQRVIDDRKIKNMNKYKEINTFIVDKYENIRKVCDYGTCINNDQYKSYTCTSNTKFHIVDCILQNKKYRGSAKFARIQISCINGSPVHYIKHLRNKLRMSSAVSECFLPCNSVSCVCLTMFVNV